jgi:hypothetical protein
MVSGRIAYHQEGIVHCCNDRICIAVRGANAESLPSWTRPGDSGMAMFMLTVRAGTDQSMRYHITVLLA